MLITSTEDSCNGCDTTSFIFGQCKTTVVKTFKKSKQLDDVSKVITNMQSSQREVGNTSLTAFTILFGGSQNQTLAKIR